MAACCIKNRSRTLTMASVIMSYSAFISRRDSIKSKNARSEACDKFATNLVAGVASLGLGSSLGRHGDGVVSCESFDLL